MKKPPFEGAWDVAAVEHRTRGEWRCEYELGADDWSIGFLPDGRFLDIYRPEDEKESARWSFDEASGIISIESDTTPVFTVKRVFEQAEDGAYLYFFDDERHIRPNCRTVIALHAHTRYRLVRTRDK